MPAFAPFLETLAAQEHSEGGWGYVGGQAAHLEPTCLALLALSLDPDRHREAVNRGLKVLERSARPDGCYVLERGRPQAVWTTALVLFIKTALKKSDESLARAAACLLESKGRIPDDPLSSEIHDFDATIPGWAWAEGNFAWIEPTAWACLALRKAGLGNHPRVRDGLRLLLDRAHDEGGVNYGNRRIYGRLLEPMVGPSTLMLLALQGVGLDSADALMIRATTSDPAPARPHPRVQAALNYLIDSIAGNNLEHLAWAKLALAAHRHEAAAVESALGQLDQQLLEAHAARGKLPWAKPAPLLEALTALALSDQGTEYFRLPPDQPSNPLASSARTPARTGLLASLARQGQRVQAYFRRVMVDAAGSMRPLPVRSAVHIAAVADYDDKLVDVLSAQFAAFREQVPLAGKRVVLKPNLVEWHRDKPINTHPLVVRAAIELCRREGAAEVAVGEGPGHCRNVEFLLEASGFGDVLRELNVPFVDLNHDEPVKRLNLGRTNGLEHLFLARTAVEADVLISMPKLKTHHWAGVTLSLKNLFGIVPGICYGWPKNELHWCGIERSIVDIALTRTPQLAIVDGIVGMEGDGPLGGSPQPLGALIMGVDPVAVDATCCRLMQMEPTKIGYLMLAHAKRLGLIAADSIDQLGEPIDKLARPFAPPPKLDHLTEKRAVLAL